MVFRTIEAKDIAEYTDSFIGILKRTTKISAGDLIRKKNGNLALITAKSENVVIFNPKKNTTQHGSALYYEEVTRIDDGRRGKSGGHVKITTFDKKEKYKKLRIGDRVYSFGNVWIIRKIHETDETKNNDNDNEIGVRKLKLYRITFTVVEDNF